MEATQIDVLFGKRVTGDFFGRSVRDGKSEFTVRFRGLNIGVRIFKQRKRTVNSEFEYRRAYALPHRD